MQFGKLLVGLRNRGDKNTANSPHQRQALIFYRLAGPVAFFLLPFIVKTLVYYPDRLLVAAAAALLVALTATNTAFLYWKGTLPIPSIFISLAATLAVGTATWMLGLNGVFWTYTALIMTHFLLQRGQAIAINGLLLVATVAFIYPQGNLDVVGRVGASLLVCIVFLHLFTNVTEELQDALREAAMIDPLTGAYNRRQLEKSITKVLERHRRHGAPAALLMLDIDHFKRVNDELGHAAGDVVLRDMTEIVQAHIRKLDSFFRIGGEEFLVLLPDTGEAGALEAAEKLRAAVADAKLCPDGRRITVSVGVGVLANVDTRTLDNKDLLARWMLCCDRALYRAKSTGRNRVVLGKFDLTQA